MSNGCSTVPSRASGARVADPATARLRLLRTSGVGPVTYRQLIGRYGSAEAAIAALPMLAARGGGRAPVVPDERSIAREMTATERASARYLFLDDADYPSLLAETDSAPPALIVRGDTALATARPCIALVGARNASAAACRFARELAYDLVAGGANVVSGLARGIDTAAHQGSVGTPERPGATIGVIASGIDIAYPPDNAELQEMVAVRGLLIAEQPPGTEPRARHFPYRNRIIAGLSLGTVVVEAVQKSGSLITARLAGEMGREVMAVPGSPIDPRAQGGNMLIQHATVTQHRSATVSACFRWPKRKRAFVSECPRRSTLLKPIRSSYAARDIYRPCAASQSRFASPNWKNDFAEIARSLPVELVTYQRHM